MLSHPHVVYADLPTTHINKITRLQEHQNRDKIGDSQIITNNKRQNREAKHGTDKLLLTPKEGHDETKQSGAGPQSGQLQSEES